MNSNKTAKILILIFLVLGLNSCDKDKESLSDPLVVLNFKPFTDDSHATDPEVSTINMLIFKEDVLTKNITHKQDISNKISIAVEDIKDSKSYFIADPNNMTDYALTEGVTSELDFAKQHTRPLNIAAGDVVDPFYAGEKDFIGTTDYSNLNFEMVRRVARIDISLEAYADITVQSATLKNVSLQSHVYKQSEPTTDVFAKGNFTKTFNPILTTNTEAVFYLLEEQTANSILELEVKIDGETTMLAAKLPAKIVSNNIYDVKISGSGTTLKAHITARAWEVGGNVDVIPDMEFTKIDVEQSDLKGYIRVSATKDTVFVPSSNTTFKLTVAATSELEVMAEGDIVMTPHIVTDSYLQNSYNIRTTPKSQEKIAYLKIKNKYIEHDYDDRIVIVLEESKIKYTGKLLEYVQDVANIQFGTYIDGDLGTIQIPATSEIVDQTTPEWIRFKDITSTLPAYSSRSFQGGYRPNNMAENGNIEELMFSVKHATGESEHIKISRVQNALPVVTIHGQYWCMYNLRGHATTVSDQILEYKEDLFEYLATCSNEDVVRYAGDVYKGTDLNGLAFDVLTTPPAVVGGNPTKKFIFKNYETSNSPGAQGSIKTCPDGYSVPKQSDMSNIVYHKMFGSSQTTIWTAGLGRQVLGVQTRGLTYKGLKFGNGTLNIYYSKAADEAAKLVLYGLAFKPKHYGMNTERGLFLYQKPDNSLTSTWAFYHSNHRVYDEAYSDSAVTRYIRCIKEPTNYFIY